MLYLAVYGAMAVVFLALDAVMLSRVMKPLFEAQLGDMLLDGLRYGPAMAFYAFYIVGLLWFAVLPGLRADSLMVAVLSGAFLGALAYGTYEFTNLATLKPWTWTMVMTDLAWGTVLSGITAGTGLLVARWAGLGFQG